MTRPILAHSAMASAPRQTATMDDAWAAFVKAAEELHYDQDQLNNTWFAAIHAVCGHEDADRVSPEQWAEILAQTPKTPF